MTRSELEINKIYHCRLSGFKMIVSSKEEVKTPEGKDTVVVMARYFNRITGSWEHTHINDGQLDLTFEEKESIQKAKYENLKSSIKNK